MAQSKLQAQSVPLAKSKKKSFATIVARDFIKNKYVYMMLAPVLAYYFIFCYMPMYGATIAFKDFDIVKGVWGSEWVGFQWFHEFFNDFYFWRLLKNTVILSVGDLAFGFPAPIILALLMNEIKNNAFKRTIQTVTYMPHFISMVVICGLITQFLARDGMITNLLATLGVPNENLLAKPEYFRTIFISSNIWQQIGWSSILYLSALTTIDPQLYEAATIDGAGKWRQLWNVTIPGILPMIVILLILRMGHIMSIGYEKVMLLYSPVTYSTADIISTYVYRKGVLESAQFSYSTAIGLFNSVINLLMLLFSNWLSKKLNEQSLW